MRTKLKILWLRENGENIIGAHTTQYEFEQVVGKYADCKYAGKGFPDYVAEETIEQTVDRVMPDADWVMDSDTNYHIKKPQDKSYKVGVFISDIHGKHLYGINNPVEWAYMLKKAEYDAIFMRIPLIYGTPYRPEVVYEILQDNARWLPWSVNINKFYRRDEMKYDVTFLGARGDNYPLRKIITEGIYHVARGYKILCSAYPTLGGQPKSRYGSDYIIGDKYYDALGSSRILIFDVSRYRYPLIKLFEGSASGCLLMTDPPAMNKRLGFRHRLTYAEIDDVTWEEGLQYYLKHPKEAKKIADRGMRMTRKYHTHEVRAQQFVKILKEMA